MGEKTTDLHKSLKNISPLQIVFTAVIAVLFICLYGFYGNAQEVSKYGHSAIFWMIRRWNGVGGDMSHGWIIPLVSIYILWRERRELADVRKKSSVFGIAVIASLLILLWIGVKTQLTRLSLLSMIGMLWAIPFCCFGWQFAKLMVFPCAYLLFCIPLSFLNTITVPLRLFVSSVSTVILNGIGISSVRIGTMIHSVGTSVFNLDVADPCSGLRSLLALTAITAAYSYLTQKGFLKRWLLFLAAFPIAMAGNVVRIVSVAIIARLFGQNKGLVLYHDYSGFVVFAVAILLMIWFGQLLNKIPCKSKTDRDVGDDLHAVDLKPAGTSFKIGSMQFGVVSTLMFATILMLRLQPDVVISNDKGVRMELPEHIGAYTGVNVLYCQNEDCPKSFMGIAMNMTNVCPVCGDSLDTMSIAEKNILPADTVIVRKQYTQPYTPSVTVAIVLSGAEQKSLHRPQQCLPAQGLTIERSYVVDVPLLDDKMLSVMMLDARRKTQALGASSTERVCYAYWFVGKDRKTPYFLQRLLWMAEDRIFHNTAYRWAYISVMTSGIADDSNEYEEHLKRFISELYPLLRPSNPIIGSQKHRNIICN